jgi:hypothetical protein
MLRMITKMTLLAFASLIIASTVEAKPNSYLFRLTASDIDEVMTRYYPRGYDRDATLRQMSEPFDCRNFGDLCTEVGERYAYQMAESAWTKAKIGYSLELISRDAESEIEEFSQRWFEQTYPNGVPDKDPFWGEERAAAPDACTGSASVESGNFRVKHTSNRHSLVAYAWGRVITEHFKKDGSGNWKPAKADRLEVQGTIFFHQAGFDPFSVTASDLKYTAKSVAANRRFGGIAIVAVPFVEGCGGIGQNSPLFVCSCSGTPVSLP